MSIMFSTFFTGFLFAFFRWSVLFLHVWIDVLALWLFGAFAGGHQLPRGNRNQNLVNRWQTTLNTSSSDKVLYPVLLHAGQFGVLHMHQFSRVHLLGQGLADHVGQSLDVHRWVVLLDVVADGLGGHALARVQGPESLFDHGGVGRVALQELLQTRRWTKYIHHFTQ